MVIVEDNSFKWKSHQPFHIRCNRMIKSWNWLRFTCMVNSLLAARILHSNGARPAVRARKSVTLLTTKCNSPSSRPIINSRSTHVTNVESRVAGLTIMIFVKCELNWKNRNSKEIDWHYIPWIYRSKSASEQMLECEGISVNWPWCRPAQTDVTDEYLVVGLWIL